ncbi:MAG TPA: CBS domain-containing protein [Terriglobales bacterium]|jgi:CBS domain-containing protein|nr:CBS domain-containing protein [Terriglobales bacterium]
MKVAEVMTTEVETVQMNSTLEEAASIMKVENVGAIPVVDEEDDLVGIITDRDIVVRCVAEGKDPADTNVEEVLSHELETIEPDVDVEEAARLMADKQIRRLPVCQDGELVGMISIGDLAVKATRPEASGAALREISQGVRGGGGDSRLVTREARVRMFGSAQGGGSRAAHAAAAKFSDDEDLDLEFSDEKDLAMSEAWERHSNRHHQSSQKQKGAGGSKSKLRPITEGRPQQDLRALGQRKQAPGISNQQANDELKRNNRVVAIREDAQTGRKRRTRKAG